ncbi:MULTISPECIES: glycine cleavage system protein GcvH [unclassified Apibacter]|uniref:glycine cleavage system protein GcvH n=1 Tax=unclassified Apibacter TaxID=2630820 RepID=UPI0013248B74|nr:MULTISPECIES: glycine cleavage system protein GcvH [unclassified Apibacter]MCX8677175.1 glycine cleavage system protein GcvH [Apibacter sp. B3919]MXO24445.1 glycine cleavage system protein GcvH [Apibacter sp. B3924]MXO25689.1 glycine cleavage system protein GcvH [Apibacter sp. B3813]MXO27640.1 glycine cleavage system protein GcvH [Apibacter sp. B3913]MXO30000.1 glycine cleavage system protein GcvH [Apibacter sp. B3912]
MKTPSDLLYSSKHVWIKIEGNTALIGITDYAQQQLGDVIYIDVNSLGNQLKLDEIFGTVEAIKTVSDLFMPVDGKVLEMNLELENLPTLVNTDPYGKGWIIKVQIQNNTLLDQLLNAEDYKKLHT